MREAFRLRVRILAGAILAVGLILLGRSYMITIVQGAEYRREAQGQYTHTAQDIFERGTIFMTDKDGNKVAGAGQKSGYMVVVDPTKVSDPDKLYAQLKPYTELEKDRFHMQVTKKDDPYEEVAHFVDEETAEELRKKKIPGVQLFREQWRFYPGGSLAAQTLGFVAFDEEGIRRSGRYGLEKYWNDVLERADARLYVNFFAELFSNVRENLGDEKRMRAGDIVTTIEPSVQVYLEQTLAEVSDEWHAKDIGGIIMDPKTGEVIALANLPTFDPNNFSVEKSPRVYSNRLIEDVREMGSIIKPIAMAIGLDTGAVTRATLYDDTGRITVDGYTISNYDGRARGTVPMQEVLSQSLNVGMAYVARKIGREEFSQRMKDFGFGEETGIDLPYESHGLIDNLDSPRDVELITASFGQGIATTPIETVRALAALGNGGLLVTPHLVKRIEYEEGGVSEISYAGDAVRVLKPETSEEITRMLVEVVDKALRGGTAKKEHYSIAAKTGTAQIADVGARGYYDDRYLHSFFGYFPAYDPRFIIFLYHVEPQGAKYASETLTTPFMELADYLINYYAIPPDR